MTLLESERGPEDAGAAWLPRATPVTPWVRTVKASGVDCVVTVGEHVMFVRRADDSEPTEAEHRAALVEALGKAVAEIAIEHEACAKVAERDAAMFPEEDNASLRVAAAIRKRRT